MGSGEEQVARQRFASLAAGRSTPDLATPAYSMEPEQLNLLANTLADLKSRSAEMRRLL
jgi:hypothetical protein